MKIYSDCEDSETKKGLETEEYKKLIVAYERIKREYDGNQNEWFGVKWTRVPQRRTELVVREDRGSGVDDGVTDAIVFGAAEQDCE